MPVLNNRIIPNVIFVFIDKKQNNKKNSRSPLLSMRLAMLTVSPNKQYRGIANPTTPAHTGPVCRPIRRSHLLSGKCLILKVLGVVMVVVIHFGNGIGRLDMSETSLPCLLF